MGREIVKSCGWGSVARRPSGVELGGGGYLLPFGGSGLGAERLEADATAGLQVAACRRGRGSCGELGAFDEDAPLEAGAGPDEGDEVRTVHRPPAVLGGLDELERHGEAGGFGAGALGHLGP